MTPEQIDRLHDEMKEILRSEPMRAYELAELIIEQSAAIGYERYIPYAHYIHGFGHIRAGRNEEASMEFDLAIRLAQEAGDRAVECRATDGRGTVAGRTGHYAEAKDYYSKAIEIARESGDLAFESIAFGNLCIVLTELGDYSEALRVADQGLALAEGTGDKYSIGLLFCHIGVIHDKLADYPRALEYYTRWLALAEETGDKYSIAMALDNIGMVQAMFGDYSRVLDYFARSLALAEEIGDKREVAKTLGNLGVAYKDTGDYIRALEYFKRALELSEQIGARSLVGFWMHGIAEVESKLGNLDAAYQGFLDTLHYRREVLKSNEEVASTLLELGCVLIEQGKTEEGLARLNEALALADELGEKNFAANAHKDIADAYSKMGDMAKAFEHLTKHLALDKEIFSEESRKSIEKFNMRVAIANQERDTELARLRVKESEHETEVQQIRAEQSEKELSNATLQLIAQTELLSELRDGLLQFVNKFPLPDGAAKELRDRLKMLPCKSVDWKKFDMQFKAAHPDFVKKLIELHPDLTPQEVRISALLRMNLKSEEIARLFCLSARSIENHRFRIRRKFGLAREVDLVIYLSKI